MPNARIQNSRSFCGLDTMIRLIPCKVVLWANCPQSSLSPNCRTPPQMHSGPAVEWWSSSLSAISNWTTWFADSVSGQFCPLVASFDIASRITLCWLCRIGLASLCALHDSDCSRRLHENVGRPTSISEKKSKVQIFTFHILLISCYFTNCKQRDGNKFYLDYVPDVPASSVMGWC